MDENRMRFGVGVLVVASLGIAVILTFFFGAYPNLFAGRYTVTVRFDEAPGVGVDTPVLKNGVRIGRVVETQLLTGGEGEDEGVLLTLEVGDEYPLRLNQVPRVTSGSLITGDAQIEFIRANENQLLSMFDGQANSPPNNMLDPEEQELAKQPMRAGIYIEWGEVQTDPLEMVVELEDEVRSTLETIQRAGQSIETAGRSVNRLATQVEELVGGDEGEIRDLARRARDAMETFDLALQDVRSVIGNPELQEALRASAERLPVFLDEAQQTLQTTQRTLESFERVGAAAERTVRSAEKTAENIAQFTDPLAENGEELVAGLLRSLGNFDRTIVQIGDFSDRLNRSDGSLRRLMEDDELYWQIKRVMDNIEGASVKIRPILDDVRVLSDKLARDPRQLGVRGALNPRPSGMGLK